MEKQKNKSGIYFFLVAFVLSLYALFKLYTPFLTNILIAFLLFIATQGIYNALLERVKSEILSSFLTTLFLVLLCFIPIFYVLLSLASMATNLDLGNFHNFLLDTQTRLSYIINATLEYLPKALQSEIQSHIANLHTLNWSEIAKRILTMLASASKNSLTFLSDTIFIVVFLFFFYYYGAKVGRYFAQLIPFEIKHTQAVFSEVSAVISVVFYSSLFSVALQGALFGILMFFFGYYGFLLGVFYGFASLIPIVGGALVWIPIAGYEAYLGNYTNALIIALYSIIIIATIADNVIKPFIISFINRIFIKKAIVINEMLIFFAILAGLSSFGFWGIVLGPAITALFIALLRIYEHLKE